MNSPLLRWASRLLGVALLGAVLLLVDWRDEVVDGDGVPHRGEIESVEGDVVRLRGPSGVEEIRARGPGEVRRGLRSVLGGLLDRPGIALLAATLLLASTLLIQVRWAVLLRGAGLPTPFPRVVRLGWIGMFFNQVLPAGQVGGDLAKAYLIAREHPGRKTQAVVSVLADRGIGLFTLCMLAAAGVALGPRTPRLWLARGIVLAIFVASSLLLLLLVLPAPRVRARLAGLGARLPGSAAVRRVAAAVDLYGRRPFVLARAAGIALAVHATLLAGIWFAGAALGARLSPFALLVIVPVAQIAGSVPGLPAGWGVGDMAFWFFLPEAGVPPATAVAISFTFRAILMLISLPGALLLGPRAAALPQAK